MVEAGEKLSCHLKGRVPPMEREELSETVNKIQQRVLKKHKNVIIKDEEDAQRFKQMLTDKVKNILRYLLLFL